MTKFASDAFLPAGALDTPTNGSVAAISSRSGIDDSSSEPSSSILQSIPVMQSPPINPSNRNDPRHTSFFNTDSGPERPRPFHSLRLRGAHKGMPGNSFHPNITSLSPLASWNIGGTSLARSISVDAAVPPQASSRYYSGIGSHSALIDNWRLERSNLDALRRRAEQLYLDQQAVISEMSEEWLKEKTEMSQLIYGLRERVQRLEGENTVLKSIACQNPCLVSPQGSIQSGGLGRSQDSNYPSPHRLPGRNAPETSAASTLPPGLDGASRRPHFARQGGSACISPNGAPIAGGIGSLSPRTEPQQSTSTDFLLSSSSPELSGDIPIIDVQEIDPKLEGIPIKATAIQKPTFEQEPVSSAMKDISVLIARLPSPPISGFNDARHKTTWGAWERERLHNEQRRPGLAPLTTAQNPFQARHILDADEARRLTMHAGHTPNHSSSLFPTMTSTGSSSYSACSEEVTPSAWPFPSRGVQHAVTDHESVTESDDLESTTTYVRKLDQRVDEIINLDMAGYSVSEDDISLRGPLMIKNIPAQDEIFWEQVKQRLDPISRGEDALPRVLKSTELEFPPEGDITTVDQPGEDEQKFEEEEIHAVPGSKDESNNSPDAVELDIPLMFKATSNFGAPFGNAE